MITLALLHPINKTPVQSWSFEQQPTIRIGRSTDNDVILYSAVVSRHHVEIYHTDKGWVVKSLGTNGTYVEGKRVDEMPVSSGMVIRLARSGPNIQIHTTPDKRDALKDLLDSRLRSSQTAKSSNPADRMQSPVPEAQPHEPTFIGADDEDPDQKQQ